MKRADIGALTGLRGLAALWVLASHFIADSGVPALAAFAPLFQSGYLGVDLFFVLSGFVLAHTYRDTTSASLGAYRHFLRKRLARIYPAHIVVLLALGAAVATNVYQYEAWQTQPRDFVRSALLMEAWVPMLHYPWNGVTWSISAEMGAYLVFPLIAAFVFRPPAKSTPFALGALAAFMFLVLAYVGRLAQPVELPFTAARILCEFVAGVLIYRLWDLGVRPFRHTVTALLVLMLGSAVIDLLGESREAGDILPIMAMFIVLGLASAPTTAGIGKVLSSRPAQFLGRVSYCIYLVHRVLLLIFLNLIGNNLVAILFALLSTAVIAPALYHFVEEPMRRLLSRDRLSRARVAPGRRALTVKSSGYGA